MTRQYETKHANAFLILLHPLKRRVSRKKQKKNKRKAQHSTDKANKLLQHSAVGCQANP
jgi:hypothetical protein